MLLLIVVELLALELEAHFVCCWAALAAITANSVADRLRASLWRDRVLWRSDNRKIQISSHKIAAASIRYR